MRRSSLAVAMLLALAAVPIFSPQEARAAPPDSSAIAVPEFAPAPMTAAAENVLAFNGTTVAQVSAASVIASQLSPSATSAIGDVGTRLLAIATSDWALALAAASILIGLAVHVGSPDRNRSKHRPGASRSTRHDPNPGFATASG